MVNGYFYWASGRGLRTTGKSLIPFAAKPGRDILTGASQFKDAVRSLFKFGTYGQAWQAHHLLSQQAVKEVDALFKETIIKINGREVVVPGVSIQLHHPTNGAMLPAGRIRQRSGYYFGKHQGSHPRYNEAQIIVMQEIAQNMRASVLRAQAAGDLDAAFAAVRLAEERLARMQQLCCDALVNKVRSKLIPLNAGRGASQSAQDLLRDAWLAQMRRAL